MSDDRTPSPRDPSTARASRLGGIGAAVVPVGLLVAAVWFLVFGGDGNDGGAVTITDTTAADHDHDPDAADGHDDGHAADGHDDRHADDGHADEADGHDHESEDVSADAGFATDEYEQGLVVGDTTTLADGAQVRVRSVTADVDPAPGSPPAGDGLTLHRVDVEVCATDEEVFVDASLWFGYASDGSVRSAHMGVRDLRTMVLLPSRCQRGTVDLPVPADERLEAVLLSEHGHHQVSTVARWDVDGSAPRDLPPLSTDTPPDTLDIEERAPLPDGGWAQVYDLGLAEDAAAAEGTQVVQLHVERCAGTDGIPTGPGDWLLQTDDLRLFAPDASTATYETVQLDAKDCMRGTVDITVPDDGRIVAIVAAHAGSYEEARWVVDADPRPVRN